MRSSPDLRDARARNLSAMRSRDSVCLCAARVRPVINNPFKSNRNTHFCGLLCRSGSVPSVRACVCPFCWHSARCDRVRDQRHYARNASTNPLIRCGILIHVCAVAACMSMLFFFCFLLLFVLHHHHRMLASLLHRRGMRARAFIACE